MCCEGFKSGLRRVAKVQVKQRNGRGYLVDRTLPLPLRIVRYVFIAGVLLALLLIALLSLYRIPGVHPVSTLMIRDLVTFQGYDRQWVSIDDMAPSLVNSVMMSEDGQFCTHAGVDWREMQSVVSDAMDGAETRGASTIPMQTVKNLFLWNGRSFIRKGMEMPLALLADMILSKRRIMEIYLNIAEWGPGIYGAEAAAQHHFGVSASRLSPRQAAYLAVSLPNPIARNPAKPGRGLQRLARIVEGRAKQAGAYVSCVKSAG